jgi:hypothetical protein
MGTFIRGAGDLRLGARPAGGGSSLLTGLVSYWTMNETSGARSDSTGLNALTDNNTVVGSAGKIGNAADFAAVNSEFLSRIDTDNSLDGGDTDFTFSLWVKTTAVLLSAIFTKSNTADYGLDMLAAGTLRWEMTSFDRTAEPVTVINDGNWHHVACWHTASTGILSIAIDNGTVTNSTALASYFTDNNPFLIGFNNVGTYFTGSIDEMGRWSRVLTAAERTSLYNSGTGITYPFVGA